MLHRDVTYRDDFHALLGGPKERRRVMREIKQLEAEELRRLHSGTPSIHSHANEDEESSQHDTTYLTQPESLQGLTEGRGRTNSKGDTLYGRPTSAYSRGSSPSLLLSAMEEELDPQKQYEKMLTQKAHAATLSVPRNPPSKVFTEYVKAPSAMRKRGLRSPDVLFEPGQGDNGVFWLYDKHRVSQSTLGSAAGTVRYGSGASVRGAADGGMDEGTFKKLPVWANIKRKLTNMIAQGAQQERFGIVFDIVSTGKILAKGIPHMAGKLIYEFVEDCRHEAGVNKLKFIFVGITDNINCCTARDVFCLDDRVAGAYVGDFKRPFTALDNVHMFAILPPTGSRFYDEVLHAAEPGYLMTHPEAANTSAMVSALRRGSINRPPSGGGKSRSDLPPLGRSSLHSSTAPKAKGY